MAGIQTAIGQLLGAVGGAALVGKKGIDDANERQAAEAEEQEQAAQNEAIKKALAQAVSYKKLDRVYFWKGEEPLADSNEMAALSAQQSLNAHYNTKLRTKKGTFARLQKLRQVNPATYEGATAPKEEVSTWGQR